MTHEDPWARAKTFTPARIALGRVGGALPTREVLRFSLAHAQARDAVHVPLDLDRLECDVAALGFGTVRVESLAPDRATYLARPDLGRILSEASRERLAADAARAVDLALVVADGLSSPAAARHAAPFLAALAPWLAASGLRISPVAVALQARVALGDEVGRLMGARAVVMLIGERPGLSAPDSLGAYLTFGPEASRTDAERNCISNIRAAGLPYDLAAFRLAWLLDQAFARGLTGVALKDESDALVLAGRIPVPSLPASGG